MQKFKVDLNPLDIIFLKLFQKGVINDMGVTERFSRNKNLKTRIKGVFNRSYCCYGILLNHEDDHIFVKQ